MPDLPLPARFGQQMGVATTLYRGLIERLLSPHGLTWPQFSMLLHLAHQGKPRRISDIAAAVELTQPAVSKVVQKFLTLGWIDLVRDGADARNRPVRITAAGHLHMTAVQQSFGPAFARLLDSWQAEDLERLIVDLARLSRQLETMRLPESDGKGQGIASPPK